MRAFYFIVAAVFLGGASSASAEEKFRNRLGVGLNGRLNYERLLGFGFRIGTDLKLHTRIEGSENVHADQRPDHWLITASHCFSSKFADWENRVSFLSSRYDIWGTKINSGLRKRFEFEDRWALSPSIMILEYVIDPTAYNVEWPSRRVVHFADIKTDLGLELELHF